MTSRSLLLASTAVLLASAVPAVATAGSAHAAGLAVPVKCETSAETVLAWDDVTYDLQGTCGVVRITADDAVVSMPTATRLVIDGTGNSVTAKPIYDLDIFGAANTVTTPSLTSALIRGASSAVTVEGLVEYAELSSTGSTLSADTISVLRQRGADAVTARRSDRARITGSSNTLSLTRAERLVLTGDRNSVTVARGRTTLRDRGVDNVLALRPRHR